MSTEQSPRADQAPSLPPGQKGPEQTYFEALRAGRFQIQQCGGCRKHIYYPRVLCPFCGADRIDWVTASGRGRVYSTTIVRRKPEAGGDYNVALVDLQEGPRMMSRVDGIALDQIRIGMAVSAQIISEGEQPLLVFVPAGGAS